MQRQVLREIKRRLIPYRGKIILSLGLALVSVAGTLYMPILIGEGVDALLGKGQIHWQELFKVFGKMIPLMVVVGVSSFGMNRCNNAISFQVVKDLRCQAFAHLQQLPLSYVDSHSYGETVHKMITDVEQFSDGLLMGFSQLFTGVITILGTLLLMLNIHPAIALVVVCITPLSLFVAAFIARRTFKMFSHQSKVRQEMTSLVEEMVGNQKTVQVLGYEKKAAGRFNAINQTLEKTSLRATFFSSITNPSTRFVNGLVYTGVGVMGTMMAMKGAISVGQLSSFLAYANQYTKPFNEISGVVAELQNALACAKRVFAFLEEEVETSHKKESVSDFVAKGEVIFDHVYFSYEEDKPLITDLSLVVPAQKRVAIVGPTGCGKTTLINLLMEFYEVDQGEIYLDQVPLSAIEKENIRSSFGMVLQDTWIKTGTVAENIAYGKPTATREEIIKAAKACHAHSFIMRLPKGYDTPIGEDKMRLSQGEKQLLCIARVMLMLPPMLILDEATSSIDTRTEMKIQKAFQTMMEGRTSFIVAHRLSTIKGADIILVMKDGQIIEQGDHASLLNQDGFYAKLYNSQH